MNMTKKLCYVLWFMMAAAGILVLVLGVSGCDSKTDEELTPVDFTVVSFDDIPKDFLAQIEEKKGMDFRLTYAADGWLYIARGYGEQSSGGYSIAVKEVSMSENAIYFDSELIGPRQGEAVNKLATYPYVVIKLEDAGRSVVFR